MLLKTFIRSESGAVTTDYVVLSAAMVGTGFAAINSTAVGVENIAGDIEAALRGDIVNTSFARQSYFDDFENGAGFWVGGVTDGSQDAFGGILGPYGGSNGDEIVTRTFDLLSGYDYATVEFDMLAIDSWDNEEFIIFVDGSPVSSYNFAWQQDGVTGAWTTSDPNFNISITPNGSRSQLGYSSNWSDQVYSVSVQVTNPGPSMSIGFGSTLDQSVADESWGVDNLQVTSTNTPISS
jgi:hypothetical protein